MSIQAVFWDYDNTILSTAEAHFRKHQKVLSRYGIELDETDRQRIYENNGHQNWDWIQNRWGLSCSKNDYLEAIDFEFQKEIINIEIRPGVMELFEWIKKLKLPQAIITNARKSSAKRVLDEKNITPFMDFILFKEDYEGRKPDPSPYLKGFEQMQLLLGKSIESKQALAIEDDPKGVISAHKAGLIVVQRKFNEKEVDSPYADYCCFHKEAFVKIVKNLLQK